MTLTAPQVTAVQNEYNSNPFGLPYTQQINYADLATWMNGPVVNPTPVMKRPSDLTDIITTHDGLLGNAESVGTAHFKSWVELTYSGEHAEYAQLARETYFNTTPLTGNAEFDVTGGEARSVIDYLSGVEVEVTGNDKRLYSEDAMIDMLALGELRRMLSVIGRDITATEAEQALPGLFG